MFGPEKNDETVVSAGINQVARLEESVYRKMHELDRFVQRRLFEILAKWEEEKSSGNGDTTAFIERLNELKSFIADMYESEKRNLENNLKRLDVRGDCAEMTRRELLERLFAVIEAGKLKTVKHVDGFMGSRLGISLSADERLNQRKIIFHCVLEQVKYYIEKAESLQLAGSADTFNEAGAVVLKEAKAWLADNSQAMAEGVDMDLINGSIRSGTHHVLALEKIIESKALGASSITYTTEALVFTGQQQIDEATMDKLDRLIDHSKIRELNFASCNLSFRSSIFKRLLTMISQCTALQSLILNNNPEIGDKGFVQLAGVLAQHTSLSVLELQNIGLTANEHTYKAFYDWIQPSASASSASSSSSEMAPQRITRSLTRLVLSQNNLDAKVLGAIAMGLREQWGLRYLDLNGNNIGYNQDAFGEQFQEQVGKLEYLDMGYNPITDAGAKVIFDGMVGNMRELKLSHCGLTAQSMEGLLVPGSVDEAKQSTLNLFEHLELLDVNDNEALSDTGIEHLMSAMQAAYQNFGKMPLKLLALRIARIGAIRGDYLNHFEYLLGEAQPLANINTLSIDPVVAKQEIHQRITRLMTIREVCPHLLRHDDRGRLILSLPKGFIQDSTDAKNFADYLKRSNELQERLNVLSLNDNKLGDSGFSHLTSVLGNCRNLSVLSLNKTGLTGGVAASLERLLSRLPSLRELLMADNDLHGIQMKPGIFANVEILVLDGTQLGDAGLKQLHLHGLRNLLVVSLDGVGVTENSAEEVRQLIKENPQLTEVYLARNRLGNIALQGITNGLRGNQAIRVLDLGMNQIRYDGEKEARIALFVEAAEGSGLERLSVAGNPVLDQGVNALIAQNESYVAVINKLDAMRNRALREDGLVGMNALSSSSSSASFSSAGLSVLFSGVSYATTRFFKPMAEVPATVQQPSLPQPQPSVNPGNTASFIRGLSQLFTGKR